MKVNNKSSGLRGFVPFLAIALWLLLIIAGAAPAQAQQQEFVPVSEIYPQIEEALMARGMPADATIEFDDPNGFAPAAVMLRRTSYNPLSGRFVIHLEGTKTAISGVARAVAFYPTLRSDIARGETITERDIIMTEGAFPAGRNFAESADDLSGMSARRALRAGAPVRLSDVERPTLVERGAVVTLIYERGGLRMTHQGVSTMEGGKGDIITIKNIKTERSLKGVVTDKNLVVVASSYQALEG